VANIFDTAAGTTDLSCTSPSCNGPTVTTTGSNELIFTYFTASSAPSGINSPFTLRLAEGHGNDTADYQNDGTVGAQNPVWVQGTEATGNNTVIAFKESGGGGAAASVIAGPSKLAGPTKVD
jgi:hypothetical protein